MLRIVPCLCLLATAPALAEDAVDRVLAELAEVEAAPLGDGLMTDRPSYRPGETVWFRLWGSGGEPLLYDARGQRVAGGTVDPDFRLSGHLDLPPDLAAGHYTLHAGPVKRPLLVVLGRAPATRFELRYARASHRPGGPVTAAVAIDRADGAPLKRQRVFATVAAEGAAPLTLEGHTDDRGRLTLSFDLPPEATTDARLNLRLDDGAGFTRPIPLTPSTPRVALYPEGGHAVVGLPGRVYVVARRAGDRPADFAGRVVDDTGAEVTRVASVIDGRARFELTPAAGRSYHLELDGGSRHRLPDPLGDGCVMTAVDDVTDARPTVGLDLRCTTSRPLAAIASRGGALLDAARLTAGPDAATRVELKAGDRRGPITLTVLDGHGAPLAERVIFRHRDRGLSIAVTADRPRAAPGETIVFTVKAAGPDGAPVDGDLALAVVDDAALAHADDQSPDLVAQTLLMPVVRGHLERAGRYLAPGAEAGAALDLLMGTAGYRRFESLPRRLYDRDRDGLPDDIDKCPGEPEIINGLADDDGCPDALPPGVEPPPAPAAPPRPKPTLPPIDVRPRPRPGAAVEPVETPKLVKISASRIEVRERIYFRTQTAEILTRSRPVIEAVAQVMREHPHIRRVEVAGHTDAMGPARYNLDLSQARAEAVRTALVRLGVEPERLVAVGYGEDRPLMPNDTARAREYNRRVEFQILETDHERATRRVRRFPPPPPPTEARDDFRETLAWIPRVPLRDGAAEVAVRLSDATTGFRAIAQGIGGGRVGRGEVSVSARRPLQLEVDAPLRVHRGDRFEVPVTVVNHSRERQPATVRWTSPAGDGEAPLDPLAPGERRALSLPLHARAAGAGTLAVEVQGRLSDRVERRLVVTERGYLASAGGGGRLAPDSADRVELTVPADALAVEARVELSPTTFTTLLGAAEALVRRPSGCFEQTTAAHWPNVMALRLFETRARPVDPKLIERTGDLVEQGHRRLAGFQGRDGGFSMYGRGESSRRLTAYAVVQLHETGGDRRVIERAAAWLAEHPTAGDRPTTDAWAEWAGAIGGRAVPQRPPTDDPYLLAVRILALVAADDRTRATRLAEALEARFADGRWPGAKTSVTHSQGDGLVIETTGLAVRALAALDRAPELRAAAIDWLLAARRGRAWLTTQSTVQALAAVLTAPETIADGQGGEVVVSLDGEVIWRWAQADLKVGAHVIELPADRLKGRTATVQVAQTGGVSLPWSASARWTVETPPDAPAPLRLATALDRSPLTAGAAGTLTATVSATAAVDDPLVRIGLPAGLEPDRDQLRAWTEQGRVALAEVLPGEVLLYLDRLPAGAEARFPITVTARRRGSFRGPASSAYPYYAPDPAWAAPVHVIVE